MDEQTLTALRGSIKKWEEIVAGTGVDLGMDNCALCQMFCSDESVCAGCPVAEKTGATGCLDSPYEAWMQGTGPLRGFVTDERTKALAQAELDFLRSLLPESDPARYCSYGHKTKAQCDCGPIAENE